MSARCGEVTELPKNGPGAAKFTILSKVVFHNGGQAVLMNGNSEMPLRVERVTSIPQKRINIVSFYGVFDHPPLAAPIAPAVVA